MILANVSIQEALDNGYLEIKPEPLPRERTIEVPECPYQTTSVDLRLHPEIWWLESGLGITMDLTRGSFEKLVKKCGKTREINEDQPFTLRPGKFVLGKTLEKVYLPLPPPDSDQPCYAARIEGRSSLARCGLLVHFTAPTIHAGYNGPITLEMYNLGQYPITLKAEDRVCQLILEEVRGAPTPSESQFQEQRAAAD